MKTKKPNAELVWKQMEDELVPRLRWSAMERSVYSYLLRHSWLEGKPKVRFSILGLARHVRVSGGPAREAVRRLVEQGVLRLLERSKAGHVVEVRLPEEIVAAGSPRSEEHREDRPKQEVNIEEADFLQDKALRQAIHAREGRKCFYCLRETTPTVQCLDHVVPRAQQGRNSYRNLVSCCMECNSRKGERAAADYLRELYRKGQLTAAELAERLQALDDLAAGKLRPSLPATANLLPSSGRPPLQPAAD
jgi:5-methylcytosine-specific restriction endonuclease McrA